MPEMKERFELDEEEDKNPYETLLTQEQRWEG